MIDAIQIATLLKLLAAHLVADFLLQPRSWITDKREHRYASRSLYKHIGVVFLVTWLFLGEWTHIGLPLFIALTHLGIDWWKTGREDNLKHFLLDQFLHLLMILAGWQWYQELGWSWLGDLGALVDNNAFWIVLISYIIAIWPFGYVIAMITNRWQPELRKGKGRRIEGLPNAGMWIGRAERFLILTFILLNQYSAIGFLIAAKSIFRFTGKLETGRDRKEAEYILIGTLLSFSLAIALGIATLWLLNR